MAASLLFRNVGEAQNDTGESRNGRNQKMPGSFFASSLSKVTRRLFPIRCTEQDRLSHELNSAVHEHSDALQEIRKLVRTGQGRDKYYCLMTRAALAKYKAMSVCERLEWHATEHG